MKVVTDSRTCFQVWKINFDFRHHNLTDDVTIDKELFFFKFKPMIKNIQTELDV